MGGAGVVLATVDIEHIAAAGRIAEVDRGAAVDGRRRSTSASRRDRSESAAGIGDSDLNIERVADNLDLARIRNRARIAELAALAKRDDAGIVQNAVTQNLRDGADAQGPKNLEDRIGAQADVSADRQRAILYAIRHLRWRQDPSDVQLRSRGTGRVRQVIEVIHRHGMGERRKAPSTAALIVTG